jgi:hypothetical protein
MKAVRSFIALNGVPNDVVKITQNIRKRGARKEGNQTNPCSTFELLYCIVMMEWSNSTLRKYEYLYIQYL